jgi:NAD(P)H-hydrate epimerase
MTTAARSATDIILDRFPKGQRMLIVCGHGNNGGDGFAMAHMLAPYHDVHVITTADPAKLSPEARHHYERSLELHQHDGRQTLDVGRWTPDIVIDALIGVGGTHELREPVPDTLRWMNAIEAFKIAVDVPTGLHAETGDAHPDVFVADLTITMEGPKTGFFRKGGRQCVGEIDVAHIGAPDEIVQRYAVARIVEDHDLEAWLPPRQNNTSKFDYGRVLVIAGSRTMRGAAALTSEAALRIGAGLVILATPSVHPLVLREVMTEVLPMHDDGTMSVAARPLIEQQLQRASVVAIGPGIGTNEAMLHMLADVVNAMDPSVPVVIDADGLRIVPMLTRDMTNVVFTPHAGEMARLREQGTGNREPGTWHLAPGTWHLAPGTWHLKGVPSVTRNGNVEYWTVNGNPGMATAGSGDVLTGIIAGLIAQGMTPFHAAAAGSYLHAKAGDWCALFQPMETMIAGDLITALPYVLPS